MSLSEDMNCEAVDDPAPREEPSSTTMGSSAQNQSPLLSGKLPRGARVMSCAGSRKAPRRFNRDDISKAKKTAEAMLEYAIAIQEALPNSRERNVKKAMLIFKSLEQEMDGMRFISAVMAFPAVDVLRQCSEYKYSKQIRSIASRLYKKCQSLMRYPPDLDFETVFEKPVDKFLRKEKRLEICEDDISDEDDSYESDSDEDSISDENDDDYYVGEE